MSLGNLNEPEAKPKSRPREPMERCKKILASVNMEEGSNTNLKALEALATFVPSILVELLEEHRTDAKMTKQVRKLVKKYSQQSLLVVQAPSTVPEDILNTILRTVSTCATLYRELPILRRKLVKAIISIWARWSSDSIRITALLALHSLISRYDSLLDICLKEMYQSYFNSCKSLSAHNLGQASLLLNGLVEVFSVNPTKGCERGTRYLRQMAAALQHVIKHPMKEQLRRVFNWQFISLLRFWAHLLTSQPANSPYIKELLFPFTSILSSCMDIFQVSPRYFPFHLHCVAIALELVEGRGCIMSISSVLLKIIGHVCRQPLYKLETKKAAYDLVTICKVSQSEILTKGYLEAVVDEAFFYLFRLLKAIPIVTFPEVSASIVTCLRELIKSVDKIDRTLKKQIEGHLSKIAQQKKEIESLRVNSGLTPVNYEGGKVLQISQPTIISLYFQSLEKVRLMKKELLANKEVNQNKDEEKRKLEKASRQLVANKKSTKLKKPVQNEQQSEISKLTKRSLNKMRQPRPEKKRRVASNANNDDDIIEDLVID